MLMWYNASGMCALCSGTWGLRLGQTQAGKVSFRRVLRNTIVLHHPQPQPPSLLHSEYQSHLTLSAVVKNPPANPHQHGGAIIVLTHQAVRQCLPLRHWNVWALACSHFANGFLLPPEKFWPPCWIAGWGSVPSPRGPGPSASSLVSFQAFPWVTIGMSEGWTPLAPGRLHPLNTFSMHPGTI